MAYTMKELAELDVESLHQDQQAVCDNCRKELRENITGYRVCRCGVMCSDCYFDEISSVIEKHPIGLPGVGVTASAFGCQRPVAHPLTSCAAESSVESRGVRREEESKG